MIEEIYAGIAEYARPGDEAYGHHIRLGVEQAVQQFMVWVREPEKSRERVAEVFHTLGKVEAAEGRSLDSLQQAMRTASRIACRRLTEECERLNLTTRTVGALAEAIFVFLDEIAAAASEGYAKMRARSAGEMERRRLRLLDLLLAEPAAPRDAVAELARLAQWQVPRTVAAVALDEAGFQMPALPADVLSDLGRAQPCLIVPDPDGPGRPQMLDRALRGWRAAVGPTMPVSRAARSLHWARLGLQLARRDAGANGSGVFRCQDHMIDLIVHNSEELVDLLAATRLAPLADLRPHQRDRLSETLLAWLQHSRGAPEIAARLHVHPQTVRYRLRRIEELFGDQLQDPDTRFELEVVLRARRD
ncbi:PucR family transcriptional regulator [Bailinhaonella thermotolerans]|uniref:PucR family transcriptional regulator n=2 Tax=Bailinhaonella thermotolerans TaxID=1070861 RepID=A0A3A4ARR7_9ACTN|nr:PucR family transcriptional regulator [Bailinhaonella thermotolerans]